MTTQPSQLSPAKCHQLRENGILRLMVQLLHEHTFESHHQPEVNTNIDKFLFDFNRKSAQRQKLSRDIRMIIENTAKDASELEIWDSLEALRGYTECLYGFLADSTESKPQVIPPFGAFHELFRLSSGNGSVKKFERNCTNIVLFGGVYVILDFARAQRRFFAKFQDHVIYSEFLNFSVDSKSSNSISALLSRLFPSKNIPKTSEESLFQRTKPEDVRTMHYRLLSNVLALLMNLSQSSCLGNDTKSFLVNSRSFNQLLVGTLEDANEDNFPNTLGLVHICTQLIDNLNLLPDLEPEVPLRRYTYAADSGLVKCLVKLAMEIRFPETRHSLIVALDSLLDRDLGNVLEFCSVDGSVSFLIDVFARGNDVDECYRWQRFYAVRILWHINRFLLKTGPIAPAGRKLLAIYESREIAAVLAYRIKTLNIPKEYQKNIRNMIGLLMDVVDRSDDQRQKFRLFDDAQKTVKKFRRSGDPDIATWAKRIVELTTY